MKFGKGFALIELLLGSSLLCLILLGAVHAWRQLDIANQQTQFRHFAAQSAQSLLTLIATNPTQNTFIQGYTPNLFSVLMIVSVICVLL